MINSHSVRAFRAFSGLTSGVGIQYDHSIIVAATEDGSQSPVKFLMTGKRLPPQIVLRAVNLIPIELQDMCPSDTRFKVLIFTGDIKQSSQLELVRSFARKIFKEGSVINKIGHGAFDIVSIIKGDKETVNYLDIPAVLRSHFYKCDSTRTSIFPERAYLI
jgi:phenol 2-monooxygenase (NADPH)